MKKHLLCIIFLTISVFFEVANLFAEGFCDKIIAIEKVDVFVDNIREEVIEEQICDIARAQFAKLFVPEEMFGVKFFVRQRSYYKDINSRNSIYVHYELCDKDNKKIFEDTFASEGNSSIISAAIQEKQVARAARAIKKFLKNYNAQSTEPIIAKR